MTQNTSNNVSLSGPLVVRILDEANGCLDENRAEITRLNSINEGLKDALNKATIKVSVQETLWVTSQKVLGEQLETINHLNAQVEFFKQEFEDASNQHLQSLYVLQALKKSLENMVDSIHKVENK